MLRWQPDADIPLIVAANRDEYLDRPTLAAEFWPDYPEIFGGRDQQHGGSWMALSRSGCFAAVTNLHIPAEGARSRGHLVRDFLRTVSAEQNRAGRFFTALEGDKHSYRPFNFIASNGRELFYTDNHRPGWRQLPPGSYVIGNNPDSEPSAKRERARLDFTHALNHSDDPHTLLALLQDDRPAETGDNPTRTALSRRFVTLDNYGTRSSSVLQRHRGGDWDFWEQNFDDHQQALPLLHHRISPEPAAQ